MTAALEMAVAQRGPPAGLVVHSARGTQHASAEHQVLLKRHGLVGSMRRKANCGDLGWGNPRSMGPEFSAGLTGLEKGKFTEAPVKTQFGYHVILLEDTRVGEKLPLSALRADLSQKLAQESLVKQLKALKAAAKIELPTEKAATQPKAKSSTAPQTPNASAAK